MKNVEKEGAESNYEFMDDEASDFKIKSVMDKVAQSKKLRDSRYKSVDMDDKIDNLQPS